MRVLIVDDDPHVRSALRLLFAEEAGVDVVGECASARELVPTIARTSPGVALVDWDLPGLGQHQLRRVAEAAPECRVIAMSGRPEQRQYALRDGAVAFACKGDAPEALLRLLRELVGVALK